MGCLWRQCPCQPVLARRVSSDHGSWSTADAGHGSPRMVDLGPDSEPDFTVTDGTAGTNNYGPDPKGRDLVNVS